MSPKSSRIISKVSPYKENPHPENNQKLKKKLTKKIVNKV